MSNHLGALGAFVDANLYVIVSVSEQVVPAAIQLWVDELQWQISELDSLFRSLCFA